MLTMYEEISNRTNYKTVQMTTIAFGQKDASWARVSSETASLGPAPGDSPPV